VVAPELGNGEIGWLPAGKAKLGAVTHSLHVDLSRRTLVARDEGRPIRRMRIAVGSPRHPTPTGRFAVTDKLRVTDPSSPYGCCVLALTAHQPRLPSEWPGGDRLAVHATKERRSIGRSVSLGSMRALPRDARWLIEEIPLGAPIFIRS
jgi:lipoprotein-anchoring transpeptidase ErfK/SrfK